MRMVYGSHITGDYVTWQTTVIDFNLLIMIDFNLLVPPVQGLLGTVKESLKGDGMGYHTILTAEP